MNRTEPAATGNTRRKYLGLWTSVPVKSARRMVAIGLLSVVGMFALGKAHAQVNGAGQQPFLGWTTWSQQGHFGNSAAAGDAFQNEINVRANADAMLRLGLTAQGFKYINIDGDWDNGLMCQCGGPVTFDPWGRPVANVTRFPSGMADLADRLHRNGQKAGIYWESGVPPQVYAANTPILNSSHTAQDIVLRPLVTEFNGYYQIDFSKPGAQEYIDSIVKEFADWGYDYLKVDGTAVGVQHGSSASPIDDRANIRAFSLAIAKFAKARPIYLNLSYSLPHDYANWWQTWSNGRRVDGDVECSRRTCPRTLTTWSKVLERFADLVPWSTNAGVRRGWNDPDSLEIGNGTRATYPKNSPEILLASDPAPAPPVSIATSPAFVDGLTNDERQTAMTLWSIANAPLQLGDDMTLLDSFGVQLLTNPEVIAVDQSGQPGYVVIKGDKPIWAQSLCDGSYNVALFNLKSAASSVTVNWIDLGFRGAAHVRDVWARKDLDVSTSSYTTKLKAHGSALLRIRPQASPHDRTLCGADPD